MPDLLDASVWFALSAPDHVHHGRARRYWDEEAAPELVFCRATVLGLLQRLTHARLLGTAALDGAGAWRALSLWLAQERVTLREEPAGLDDWLGRWSAALDLRGERWPEAYLAAFAAASGARLVAFDVGFRRYPDLEFLQLAS